MVRARAALANRPLAPSLRVAYTFNVALNVEAAEDRRALADALLDELAGRQSHDWLQRLRKCGMSLVHLQVLMTLGADGPLSMSRLAEALDVSEASATGIVGRMERRGFVERRHATDDRRIVLVHPTPAGEQEVAAIEETRRRHLSLLLDELTADELTGFLAGLRALHAAGARLRESASLHDEAPGS
jgi:DNA-binding MarR family transcriptional regulator